ncbi:MAG: family peptidase [Sphingomonas bacterium]|nr:family peptidase [Sphingomonas bacterium]
MRPLSHPRPPLARLALAALAVLLVAAAPVRDDPHLALEEIEGTNAIATVKRWNGDTAAKLTAQPRFAAYRKRAEALLEDDAQIAAPDQIIGGNVLNVWHDARNPRGLWRIASLDSFASGSPQWTVLIDLDALGRAEKKSWVWHGVTCRAPAYDRCMVALADGGTDAVVEREFDIAGRRFVAGGFVVPQAKTKVAWAGPDALYVATDYGPGSMTKSGYARRLKLWRRGTPLAQARQLAEIAADDVELSVSTIVADDAAYPIATREIDTYRHETFHIAADGRLVRTPLPLDADVQDIIDGRLVAQLNSDWGKYPAGSLVAYPVADLLAGKSPAIEQVMVPTRTQSIEQVSAGKSVLWVKLLDDVSGKIVALTRTAGGWRQEAAALPGNSTIDLDATAGVRDVAFATVQGMLTPPTLYAVTPGAAPRAVQALPARFDASNMTVEQRFATAKDGVRIPYFLVRRKDVTGPVPALVHAYGGFRSAQTPSYLTEEPYRAGPTALFWVEEGNAYILANIRGGGEYGPAWHDATVREKHQTAFDDFYAVAEDLVRTGVSAAGRIAASGRSNGGLLVGAAMTQRPELYGAVVMGSPLTDMKRYSHLLAGASWMGEYGDPDKPEDWAFIRRYSPYQALKPGVRYPAPFIYTSTKDDRVHPGHARKFAARLQQFGSPFYYYEALEGGHAAGADRKEDAYRAALITTYLDTVLGTPPAAARSPRR